MAKNLTDVLIENKRVLRVQMLANGGVASPGANTGQLDDAGHQLALIVDQILDLLVEHATNGSHGGLGNRMLEITSHGREQVCLLGLGPALFTLRTSIFSLLAHKLPESEWQIGRAHV